MQESRRFPAYCHGICSSSAGCAPLGRQYPVSPFVHSGNQEDHPKRSVRSHPSGRSRCCDVIEPHGVAHCFPWDAKHRLAIPGLYWKWLVSQGRESGRKLGSDYLELQYEKLVGRPQETLATLSQFIGEDLNYADIQENAVGTVARPNSSFPYTGELKSVGRWKNLSDAEAVPLSALLSPLLTELGYQAAGMNSGPPSAWRLNITYLPYWWLRQKKLKQSPLSRFLVSRDRFEPGALDQSDARWEEIRSGIPGARQTNSEKP